MKAPIPGIPSTIYLASTSTAIRALLTQDDDSREERPMSYVSRLLQGAGTRYPEIERLCLALVYTTQRLRHFFLAHKLHLMVKTDLVCYLLTKLVLSEGDTYTLSRNVLGELPEESTLVAQEDLWTLHFDGSSTTTGEVGIILTSPTEESTTLSFKLNFPYTNNMAEYEALIIGLPTTQEMGAKNIKIIGDSNLVKSAKRRFCFERGRPCTL
ncbi:hypothetical protein M0R45_036012 [Rubus argutus]|uniref:RNase H type-1 domain-containing protein n=1 Tax=Rubus argutus TaxID=59490 RepID=A0AAW1VZ04_RUBAR